VTDTNAYANADTNTHADADADAPPTPREIWHLPTQHLGRTVLVYSQLTSTNTHAADLAASQGRVVDGWVILADVQTAGRGQHGRRWLASAGASVLMSVVLYPPAHLNRPAILTAWAGVSVTELVWQVCHRHAQLKWPNDVLLAGKKVCGILIEQQRQATIVGIGVNVQQSAADFAAVQLPEAGSLRMCCADAPVPPTVAVARSLIEILDQQYALLCGQPQAGLADLEQRWSARLGLLGRRVRLELTDGSRHTGWVQRLTLAGLTLAAYPGVDRDDDDTSDPPAEWPCESIRHVTAD
jgi:BirA family biotin operon repressor/biotin-[acetyl-CoA-carboxylase] ligase